MHWNIESRSRIWCLTVDVEDDSNLPEAIPPMFIITIRIMTNVIELRSSWNFLNKLSLIPGLWKVWCHGKIQKCRNVTECSKMVEKPRNSITVTSQCQEFALCVVCSVYTMLFASHVASCVVCSVDEAWQQNEISVQERGHSTKESGRSYYIQRREQIVGDGFAWWWYSREIGQHSNLSSWHTFYFVWWQQTQITQSGIIFPDQSEVWWGSK